MDLNEVYTPHTATCGGCERAGILWPAPGRGRFICRVCSVPVGDRACFRATNIARATHGLEPYRGGALSDAGGGMYEVIAMPDCRPVSHHT